MTLPLPDPKAEAVELIMAYKRCFAGADGQTVLHDLIRNFGYTRKSTFAPGQPDKTAHNEGQRSVLIHIGNHVDVTPESLERFQASILASEDDPLLEE